MYNCIIYIYVCPRIGINDNLHLKCIEVSINKSFIPCLRHTICAGPFFWHACLYFSHGFGRRRSLKCVTYFNIEAKSETITIMTMIIAIRCSVLSLPGRRQKFRRCTLRRQTGGRRVRQCQSDVLFFIVPFFSLYSES